MINIFIWLYLQTQMIEQKQQQNQFIKLSNFSLGDSVVTENVAGTVNLSTWNGNSNTILACAVNHGDGSYCVWENGQWHNTCVEFQVIKVTDTPSQSIYLIDLHPASSSKFTVKKDTKKKK